MSDSKLYNVIGAAYNSTRRADPYLMERLYQLLSPEHGRLYIDIGCGTGNYTIAIAEKGFAFYGVEPSKKMLETGKSRNSDVKWLEGRAEYLPVNADYFDGGIATLTIHHWAGLHKAFTEIYRVLKRGAKLVIFTATPEQMRGYWLNHYFPKMMEDSIRQMPSFEAVKDAAAAAGFSTIGTEKYFIRDDLQDHFLYVGKNKPLLYLDNAVRAEISSFSVLANAVDVEKGIEQLAADINLKRFGAIKSEYDNNLGDYLFITLQKC